MRRRRSPSTIRTPESKAGISAANPRKLGSRILKAAALLPIAVLGYIVLAPQLGTNLVLQDVNASVSTGSAEAPESGAGPETGKPGKHAHKAAKTTEAEPAKPKESKGYKDRMAEDQFFDAQNIVPTFKFEFLPEEWEYLHKDPRRFAECTMTVDDDPKVWKGVAVKLKGSAGSFQGPDGKPGLTIGMHKYQKAERWHGFLKWHLNNGVQDNSFLNEQISCEMARMAGVPASRCAHALVKWQNRDLGLFVFKESFDKDFLSKFFKNPEGDLYDGGFVSEVKLDMEKDQGDRERRDNLKELIGACQEGDVKKRWERLSKILDVDEFISFIAIEAIVCHWDGYNFNRNNYRLYFDADSGKAAFFLHGTDQTFTDANFPITRDPSSMVGQAVMSNPEWKQAYHDRVAKIYETILKPIDWPARVVEVGEKVKAALALKDEKMAKEYQNRINEARDRVASRILAIGKQLGDLPASFKFDPNGVAKLTSEGWSQEGTAASLDGAAVDGKATFHVRADGTCNGSWRKTITLAAGKYRVCGRLKTSGVIPLQGSSGEGAGLRISGGTRIGLNAALGDTPWKDVAFQFDAPGGDVTLVAELRATKGEAWFDRDAFRIEQVK